MSVQEALETLEAYDLLLFVTGLALLAASVLPRLLHDKPFTMPLVMVAGGFVAFSLPLGFDTPDPIENGHITKRLTELGVIVSLMAAGLTIDRPPGLKSWSSTWRLLAVTMPLTILAVALLGWWAGLAPAAAALLGACVAPTDPVLGKDVEVGAPMEGSEDEHTEVEDPTGPGEEDEVRFALTSEAGLNDGLAFPYTNLAVAMAIAGSAPGNWIGSWLTVDVVYKIAVAIICGLAIGKALAGIILRFPVSHDLDKTVTGLASLAATLLVYGGTEYLGGYGFIATFVGAATIRAHDRWNEMHRHLQAVSEAAERILMAAILVLFGGAIAGGLLDQLGWRNVIAALVIVLVARPVAGLIGLIGMNRSPWRDRSAIAVYGIRGIATFYYLSYALEEADFPGAEQIWATAGLVVLLSLVVHGLTAAPVLQRLDRARESESGPIR